jgi:hypothetical protein
MDRKDYFLWKDFRSKDGQHLSNEEFELICELHAKYQNHNFFRPCTCSPKTILQWIKHLNIKFNESKKYRVRK